METKTATKVGCQTCKKGINKKQYGMVLFSFFILGTSIYGTVELIKYIATLF